MRDASYKVMNKIVVVQNKRVSGITAKKTATKTTTGYTKHVLDAKIANVTSIYGPYGLYGSTQINTPDFLIQGYLGGTANFGVVWNGDDKWNIYEIGANITPIRAGGIGNVDIGIFHCEIQVGVSVGLGAGFTVGGYNDDSGLGAILGAGASWFPGADFTIKAWVEY